MNESLGKQVLGEHPPAPSQLFSSVLPWPGGKSGPYSSAPPKRPNAFLPEIALLQDQHKAEEVVPQLTGFLRGYGIDNDGNVMLSLLEMLVLAGEISFADFIGRMQNLFPGGMASADLLLRQKIAVLSSQ